MKFSVGAEVVIISCDGVKGVVVFKRPDISDYHYEVKFGKNHRGIFYEGDLRKLTKLERALK